jgi:tRNA(Ile)-lysidine synthase
VLSPLPQRVLGYIRKREMMRAGDRVAVAVSGGADSVALLRIMLELRNELGVVLSVAHFNHMIRGKASDEDEQFVRELAEAHGLQFWFADADVPAHARESRLSLEAAARLKRYAFFENIVLAGDAERVATAHTLDDQAETVLMRLIRGTGITGLGAIHPRVTVDDQDNVRDGEIVRPLLEIRRSEIEEYLASIQQPWREDASNSDLHHTRNRIRQLVMPLLEREFNPLVGERLAELADIAREEDEFWSKHIQDLFRRARMVQHLFDTERTGGYTFYPPTADDVAMGAKGGTPAQPPAAVPLEVPTVAIDCALLLSHTVAEQRRILRRATECVCTLTFSEVERALELARDSIAGEIELRFGMRCWRERSSICIGMRRDRSGDPLSRGEEIHIPVLGSTKLTFRDRELAIEAKQGSGLEGAVAHAKLTTPELILRPWRPGDRFWPQHSSGPKKVKELLTDKHISGPERELWPVIACGDDIIWLRGFGVSHAFVADQHTHEALVITEQPLTGHTPEPKSQEPK